MPIMWIYAAWGVAGGLAVEGAEIIGSQRHKLAPWVLWGPRAYAFRVIVRMCLGGCVVAALSSSRDINNTFMALMSGASAPLFLAKALQVMNVTHLDRPVESLNSELSSVSSIVTPPVPNRSVGEESSNAS